MLIRVLYSLRLEWGNFLEQKYEFIVVTLFIVLNILFLWKRCISRLCQLLGLYIRSIRHTWVKVYGTFAEGYQEGTTEALGENSLSVLCCLPHIQHELASIRIWVSVLRDWKPSNPWHELQTSYCKISYMRLFKKYKHFFQECTRNAVKCGTKENIFDFTLFYFYFQCTVF